MNVPGGLPTTGASLGALRTPAVGSTRVVGGSYWSGKATLGVEGGAPVARTYCTNWPTPMCEERGGTSWFLGFFSFYGFSMVFSRFSRVFYLFKVFFGFS